MKGGIEVDDGVGTEGWTDATGSARRFALSDTGVSMTWGLGGRGT